MKRIGIMGGTFDPIHIGHLMLGRQAFYEYQLDQVWYMPSRQPPHKKDHRVTSSEERLEMVALAIQEFPYFILSDFELKRTQGNTYTSDTLELLKEIYPDTEFFFIVGADSLYDMEQWHHPEIVLNLAIILVAEREDPRNATYQITLETQINYLREKYKARIYQLHCKEITIASEEIRSLIENGQSVEDLLPEAVEVYIKKHRLYI